MSEIRVLQAHVADLIAAGEVVERPASVAKELVENAIDAGAGMVTVEISHGGLTFLRVTDDGKGIPAGELKTAFLRHATSKLRSEYDLEAIGTLGFRGEALAAIAAVSRVEVMTRTPEAQLGASLSLEGGVPGQVEEVGCPLGTTMVVRDLFYNTPARLKFMKKDAAEGAAVFAVVQRLALSHPEVGVKFIRDGKQELLTPGDGKLQSAVYAVLGRELALGFCPVRASGEEMGVRGFTSLPACCRSSRSWQYFFVNGRQVKSPLMTAAVEEAYKNQKMVGRFPACVLHLDTKLNAVDVNVHPAKTEVKFGNERQVFSAVYHAVLSALEGDRSHPRAELKASPAPAGEESRPAAPQGARLQVRDMTSLPGTAPLSPTLFPPSPPVSGSGTSAPARPAPWKGTGPRSPLSPFPSPVTPRRGPAPVTPAPAPAVAQAEKPGAEQISRTAAPATVRKEDRPLPSPPAQTPQMEEDLQQRLEEDRGQDWRLAGEVLNTYIIVEQGDKVYFIDKHAAHERMNFDRMKAQGYDPMAQTLLTPAIVRLGAEEQQALLAREELLEEFGFEVDELGGALAVRQAPADLEVEDIEPTLAQLAGRLLTTGSADPAAARDELLHTMACKAAIKGGWKTSTQELERVARAVMEGQVKYCPHGRPVAIELTRKELEKQFKRA